MSKTFLFVIGLLVFVVAAGGMWYRLADDPNAGRRYDWALEQIGVRKNSAAPSDAEAPGGRSRSLSQDTQTDRPSRTRVQQQNGLELFKLGLDLANVLVGLIGLYLAMSGMRMRRESQRQN